MIITAKFPSTCPTCAAHIAPGARVEWSYGAKARHTTCASPTPTQTQTRTPSRTSTRGRQARRTGCMCGSRDGEVQDTDCQSCRLDMDF